MSETRSNYRRTEPAPTPDRIAAELDFFSPSAPTPAAVDRTAMVRRILDSPMDRYLLFRLALARLGPEALSDAALHMIGNVLDAIEGEA